MSFCNVRPPLIIRLIVQQVYFDSSVAVPKRKGPSMDPCTDMHACFVEELTETRARRVQTPALWSKARAEEEAGGGAVRFFARLPLFTPGRYQRTKLQQTRKTLRFDLALVSHSSRRRSHAGPFETARDALSVEEERPAHDECAVHWALCWSKCMGRAR